MNGLKARLAAVLARARALLIDDWRQAIQFSSVRLHLAVIGLNALFAAMPALDPQIAGILPKTFQSPAFGIYAALGLLLRLTKLKANG